MKSLIRSILTLWWLCLWAPAFAQEARLKSDLRVCSMMGCKTEKTIGNAVYVARNKENTESIVVTACHMFHARNSTAKVDIDNSRILVDGHRATILKRWHTNDVDLAMLHVQAGIPDGTGLAVTDERDPSTGDAVYLMGYVNDLTTATYDGKVTDGPKREADYYSHGGLSGAGVYYSDNGYLAGIHSGVRYDNPQGNNGHKRFTSIRNLEQLLNSYAPGMLSGLEFLELERIKADEKPTKTLPPEKWEPTTSEAPEQPVTTYKEQDQDQDQDQPKKEEPASGLKKTAKTAVETGGKVLDTAESIVNNPLFQIAVGVGLPGGGAAGLYVAQRVLAARRKIKDAKKAEDEAKHSELIDQISKLQSDRLTKAAETAGALVVGTGATKETTYDKSVIDDITDLQRQLQAAEDEVKTLKDELAQRPVTIRYIQAPEDDNYKRLLRSMELVARKYPQFVPVMKQVHDTETLMKSGDKTDG